MKMTVGRFLEQNVENGTIAENQIIVLYDKNNNIGCIGKADYAPIYFDWIELQNYQYVGHELQINRRINNTETEVA